MKTSFQLALLFLLGLFLVYGSRSPATIKDLQCDPSGAGSATSLEAIVGVRMQVTNASLHVTGDGSFARAFVRTMEPKGEVSTQEFRQQTMHTLVQRGADVSFGADVPGAEVSQVPLGEHIELKAEPVATSSHRRHSFANALLKQNTEPEAPARRLLAVHDQLTQIERQLTKIDNLAGTSPAYDLNSLTTELIQLESKARLEEQDLLSLSTRLLGSEMDAARKLQRGYLDRMVAVFQKIDTIRSKLSSIKSARAKPAVAKVEKTQMRRKPEAPTGSYSMASNHAMGRLQAISEKLSEMEIRIAEIAKLVGTSQVDGLSVLKTELAQLESNAQQLEGAGVDNIQTGHLVDRKTEVKAFKKGIVDRFEALYPKINTIFAKMKAHAKPEAPTSSHSMASIDAMDRLQKTSEKLSEMEIRIAEIAKLVGTSQVDGLSVLKTELAQLESNAQQLEGTGVDDIQTGHLVDRKTEVKAFKKGIVDRFEALYPKINTIFAEINAKVVQQG